MIKAIPTYYRGVTFRSRLEANWAEYFDSLRLTWFYEPEGYCVGNKVGWLPDFYLPKRKLFVEVKAWSGRGLDKVGRFVRHTGQDVLVCFPNGQFLFCAKYNWSALEMGVKEEGVVPFALIRGCHKITVPSMGSVGVDYPRNGG